MNTITKIDNICNIISTIAMCASGDKIDDVEKIKYCHDEILRLTNNEEIANHAADCIIAIIAAKKS